MKQRYFLLLPLFLFSSVFLEAQTIVKYWVQFSDKNNTPYTTSNPSQFLSARSIARRAAQNIAVTATDLPVDPNYVAGVAATGAQVWCRSKWLNGVVIYTNDTNIRNAVMGLPYVNSVQGVGIRRPAPSVPISKGDEVFPYSSTARSGSIENMSLDYGASLNQISMLGGLCLHNQDFQGQGMQIAVIDAGFNSVDTMQAFDSLWANNQILGTWDFVAREASVFEDNTHGEMVLSCMGGNIPGSIVGTAPKASYWLLRSEEAATEYIQEEYFWAAAAEFADSVGADVINSSLGYTEFDAPAENHVYANDINGHTCPSSIAADYAVSRGIAVVVSAGNSGSSPWFYIGAPADADSVLAVGAVDGSGQLAGFSSRGPSADGDVKPNVAAQGQGSIVAAPGGGIIAGNGTSFASPITCGLVACLWQAHPGLTANQLLRSIEQSGNQYLAPDANLGYGIPDFCAANLSLSGNPNQLGDADQLFELGPNPFGDAFGFSFYSIHKQNIAIELYDAQGRLLTKKSAELEENSINRFRIGELDALSSGIYFLRVTTASDTILKKVVKGK